MWRRQRFEPGSHFEQKHQPMCVAFVAVLADQPGQMQIARVDGQAQFLAGLAAGAGVRGFSQLSMEFSAARTPQAKVRLLGPFQEQHLIRLIEAVEQGGNSVRQRHAACMKARKRTWSKPAGRLRRAKERGIYSATRLEHAQPSRFSMFAPPSKAKRHEFRA